MTENEKLRELLKEARESFASGESCAEARSTGCDGSAERYAHEARQLHARIDAALAEPTGPERSPLCPGEGTWSVFAEKVVKERDEARAALADAYRRGAEAMREKAAIRAENYFVSAHYASVLSNQIRHLHIEEYKP
jgi:hypothetical protein